MTHRLVKRFAVGLLAGASCVWTGAAVAADQSTPHMLLLPGFATPSIHSAPAEKKPALTGENSGSAMEVEDTSSKQGVSGITIGGLDEIDAEAIGALSGDGPSWEQDLGSDLWFAADRAAAEQQIYNLPLASQSPSARQMVHQILLTAAVPVLGKADKNAPGAFTTSRMETLVRSGNAADALALAAVLSRPMLTEPVLLARTNAQWLSGDMAHACAAANASAAQFSSVVWVKMQAACAAVTDKTDEAQLKLALLDELDGIDAGFQPIADKILGKKKLTLATLPDSMQIFEVAAFVAMGGKLPDVLPLDAKPWLALFAIPAKGKITDKHLDIVEFGLSHGVLTAADAQKVFARVKLSKAAKSKAQALSLVAKTARDRVAYWTALQGAETVTQKTKILRRLLADSRGQIAVRAALSVLLAQPLDALSHESQAISIASDAARLALWQGHWEQAEDWVDLVQNNASSSKAARQDLSALQGLMAFIDAPETAQDRAEEDTPIRLEAWLESEKAHGVTKAEIAQIRDRLLGLYRQFRLPVQDKDWLVALRTPAQPYTAVVASPVLLVATRDAAQLNARGVTMSLVAQHMGMAEEVSPVMVENSVSALLTIGAVDWAKRVAVESLLAAGY